MSTWTGLLWFLICKPETWVKWRAKVVNTGAFGEGGETSSLKSPSWVEGCPLILRIHGFINFIRYSPHKCVSLQSDRTCRLLPRTHTDAAYGKLKKWVSQVTKMTLFPRTFFPPYFTISITYLFVTITYLLLKCFKAMSIVSIPLLHLEKHMSSQCH